MPSAELAQSIILTIGVGCFAEWARRKAGPPAIFAMLYLIFPAVGLACQSAGIVNLVQPGKWASVACTGTITIALLMATLRRHDPVVRALVNVEQERRERWAREDAERAERERLAAIQRAELRGRCYALAALAEG